MIAFLTRALIVCTLALWPGAAWSQSRAWTTQEGLDLWRLTGRAPVGTARASAGVIVELAADQAPNTLRSPGLEVRNDSFNAIEIQYLMRVFSTVPASVLVGWRDTTLTEDEAERCGIRVPVSVDRVATVLVRLDASPCWSEHGVLSELAINVDQPDPDASGTFTLFSVRLVME